MKLVIDTETNGRIHPYAGNPGENPKHYPEIVSMAWSWISKVDGAHIIETTPLILKRDDIEEWMWDGEAQLVHGISWERSIAEGHDVRSSLQQVRLAMEEADRIICHNSSFDLPILLAEFCRQNLAPPILSGCDIICTMRTATNHLKLPGKPREGYNYKFPRLGELYQYLFDHPMNEVYEAHTAGGDAKATADCYLEMEGRGWI